MPSIIPAVQLTCQKTYPLGINFDGENLLLTYEQQTNTTIIF